MRGYNRELWPKLTFPPVAPGMEVVCVSHDPAGGILSQSGEEGPETRVELEDNMRRLVPMEVEEKVGMGEMA